jgi:hypothetical protein
MDGKTSEKAGAISSRAKVTIRTRQECVIADSYGKS